MFLHHLHKWYVVVLLCLSAMKGVKVGTFLLIHRIPHIRRFGVSLDAFDEEFVVKKGILFK